MHACAAIPERSPVFKDRNDSGMEHDCEGRLGVRKINNDTLEASLVPANFLQEDGCRRPMLVHGDANSVTLANAIPM